MLRDDLKGLIKGDIEDDAAILNRFSRDASLFEVRPEVVVSPKTSDDVKNIVKYVTSHKKENSKLSITARSA